MNKMACAFVAALVASACSSTSDEGEGKGTVTVTTWGESFIEEEIPPTDETGETIVEDGWTIKYSRFLIALTDVSIAEAGKAPVAKLATPKLFDMHAPGAKQVATFADLPGKAYPHVSYAVAPASADIEISAGASDADKQLMVQNGYSMYVEGTVSKDSTTKSFAWGFTTNTLYDRCKGEVSGKETDGVVVTNGGNDAIELTIHGDHLFYDDLQSPDAKVRVDNIAKADVNNDGKITLDELASVDLADKAKFTGGTYGTGSASNIDNLREFVEALSRTVGHFRGEGECVARAR